MAIDLLLFSTSWCGPCVAAERAGVYRAVEEAGFKVTKIDGDKNRALLSQYDVMAFPTMIIRKNEVPVGKVVGARDARTLIAELQRYV